MKKHGVPAAWVMTVAIIALTVIQIKALDEGINGTLLMFTIGTIAAMAAGFLGFKISDWRK